MLIFPQFLHPLQFKFIIIKMNVTNTITKYTDVGLGLSTVHQQVSLMVLIESSR